MLVDDASMSLFVPKILIQRFLPNPLSSCFFFVFFVVFLECRGKSPLPPPSHVMLWGNPRFGRKSPPRLHRPSERAGNAVMCFMRGGGHVKVLEHKPWSSSDPLAPVRGIHHFFTFFVFSRCCSCHAKWLKTVQWGDVCGGRKYRDQRVTPIYFSVFGLVPSGRDSSSPGQVRLEERTGLCVLAGGAEFRSGAQIPSDPWNIRRERTWCPRGSASWSRSSGMKMKWFSKGFRWMKIRLHPALCLSFWKTWRCVGGQRVSTPPLLNVKVELETQHCRRNTQEKSVRVTAAGPESADLPELYQTHQKSLLRWDNLSGFLD